eukprot:g424.t1
MEAMMMTAEPLVAVSALSSTETDGVESVAVKGRGGSTSHARTNSAAVMEALVNDAGGSSDTSSEPMTGAKTKVQKKVKRSSVTEDGSWQREERDAGRSDAAIKRHLRKPTPGGGVWSKMKNFASRHSRRTTSGADAEPSRESTSSEQTADGLRFARKGSKQGVMARQGSGSAGRNASDSTASNSSRRWFSRRTKSTEDDDGFRASSVGGRQDEL